MARFYEEYGSVIDDNLPPFPVEEHEATVIETEVDKGIQAISDHADLISQSGDEYQTLTAIGNVLAANSEHGISPQAAEIATIAVESICKRLGVSNRRLIPAIECFESPYTRVAATKISLESVVWDFIKDIFQALYDALKNFLKLFKGFFDSGLSAVSQKISDDKQAVLEKIKRDLGQSDVPSYDRVDGKNDLIRFFYLNNKMDADTVIAVTNNVLVLADILVQYNKMIETEIKDIKGLVKNIKTEFTDHQKDPENISVSNIKDINKKISSTFKVFYSKFFNDNHQYFEKTDKKNVTTYIYKNLPNNSSLYVGSSDNDSPTNLKFNINPVAYGSAPNTFEVPRVPKIGELIDLRNRLNEFKKDKLPDLGKEYEDNLKNITETVEELLKSGLRGVIAPTVNFTNDNLNELVTTVKETQNILRGIMVGNVSYYKPTFDLFTNTLKHFDMFMEECLKPYNRTYVGAIGNKYKHSK